MVRLASRKGFKGPHLYWVGNGVRLVPNIGADGIDEATAERELEEAYCRDLKLAGHTVRRQVRTEAGIADIVTEDAVIEVKLLLTRAAIFSAIGQVTAYAICLEKSRRVLFGYFAEGTDALIAATEQAGIQVVAWEPPTEAHVAAALDAEMED